jgi:type II secretory pathway component GspD/PulD (secretin)
VPSAVLLDPTTGLAQVSDDDVDVDDIADYFQEMRDRMQAAQDAIDNASAVDLDITAATGDGDDTVTSTVAFFTAAVSDDTEA